MDPNWLHRPDTTDARMLEKMQDMRVRTHQRMYHTANKSSNRQLSTVRSALPKMKCVVADRLLRRIRTAVNAINAHVKDPSPTRLAHRNDKVHLAINNTAEICAAMPLPNNQPFFD